MTDSQYKRTDIANHLAPEAPPGWNVRGNAALERAKLHALCRAQDTLLGGFRPVLTYHCCGAAGWLVENGDPASTTYPDDSTWRVMQRARCTIAPGANLECRALAVASGSEDTTDSVAGAVRLSAS